MNNTTPIKILTAAVLLTFGFALTANAALINKGVTEMNHEYTVSDTLSARQQAIPLIAASMASSQMDKLNAALNQGLDAGLTINEAKEILIQLYAYTGFPRSLNALNELMKVVETRNEKQQGQSHCRFRARQRFCVPGKRTPCPYAKCVRHAEGGTSANGTVYGAD